MADIKKFLDAEGVKLLWQQIALGDYPNNETLIAVINAIDETKADRKDLESIPSTSIYHQDKSVLLSALIEQYLLNIDYNLLSFNTNEIVFTDSTEPDWVFPETPGEVSILGQGILGKMVLGRIG